MTTRSRPAAPLYGPTATTNAKAWLMLWLMLTDQLESPSCVDLRSAAPCNFRVGAFWSSPRISISFHPTSPIPVPKALATASLAAKRPAKDFGLTPGLIKLGGGIDALEIALAMSGNHLLNAGDLDQVDTGS